MTDLNRILEPLALWGDLLMIAGLAAGLASGVYLLGARLVTRTVASTPMAAEIARSIRGPARWLLPLVAVELVWNGADEALPGLSMVHRLTTMLIVATLTWLLVRVVNGFGPAVIDAHPITEADDLESRRVHTQTRVLTRTVSGVIALAGLSLMLMEIPAVRQKVTLVPSTRASGWPCARSNSRIFEYSDLYGAELSGK